jgi:hypothetical protein
VLIDRVKGWVLGIAVTEVVMQGEELSVPVRERLREPVTLRVRGWVVGMPLTESVMLVEIV